MTLSTVRYVIPAPLIGALLIVALPACDDQPSEVASPDAGRDTTMPSTCGNGLIEVGEACDGADLGGQSCASLGLGEGSVGCTPTCLFDTTACSASPPACGGQVCADGEVCDAANGVCVCAGGHHACGDRCVPDDDVLTCGTRCEPCPEVAGGVATCNSGVCGTSCSAGTLACGGACAPCDDPNASTFGCAGDRCAPVACAPGYLACGGRCASCPAGADAYGCDGDQCVVSNCGGDALLCDGECAQCPDSDLGAGVCVGSRCELICDAGAHACGDTCRRDDDILACGQGCVRCPDVANANTRCEAGACVFECRDGFNRCGDTCRRDDDVTACGEACLRCPVPDGGSAVCEQGVCGVRCGAGTHECGGACVPDDSPLSCGDRCTPCPDIDGGEAVCLQGQCGLVCDPGRVMCGGRCLDCGDGGVCGPVGTCVPASCPSGQIACDTGCCTPTLIVPTLAAGLTYDQDNTTHEVVSARDAEGRLVLATVSRDLVMVRRERAGAWEDTIVRPSSPISVPLVFYPGDQGRMAALQMEPDDTALVFVIVDSQVRLFRAPVTGAVTSEVIGPAEEFGAVRGLDGTLHVVRHQLSNGVSTLWYSRRAPGAGWTDELIPGVPYDDVDVAVDSTGAPHVVWEEEQDGGGWGYAIRSAAGWAIERYGAEPVDYLSIAIDSADNVHVFAVQDDPQTFSSTECRWSRKTAAGWSDEALPYHFQGRGPRGIAFQGTTPHVVAIPHWSHSVHPLVYGVRSGATWTAQGVRGVSDDGWAADIEVDAAGGVELAFLSEVRELQVWRKNDTTWTSRPVDWLPLGSSSGRRSAAALGPDGSLHVVYMRNDSVAHLHLDGSRQQRTLVHRSTQHDPGLADVGLAVDPDGRVLVAWRSTRYVSARRFDGEVWGPTAMVNETSGDTIAIATDRSGVGHVVYDADQGFAYRTFGLDGTFGSESVIEAGVDASHAHLVIGGRGVPMAVYRKAGAVPSLRFAERGVDGTWRSETVDDGLELGNAVGRHAVLLVAPDGGVHVIYQDENARDVKHARRVASGWNRGYVATAGGAGDSLAAGFGPDGVLHAVFGVDGVAHHATWSGTTWTLTSIAGPRISTAEASGSLVVDASGRVIVGYRHTANNSEKFSLFEL